MDFVALLKKLIAFPSITPDDGGSIDFIAAILLDHGFVVHIKEFGPNKVKNLYAIYHGTQKGHNICFAGHVDVVPPGEGWGSDPFVATEKNGRIYGRGAVDMKGALACMISAVIAFIKQEKFAGAISFLITADEEGDATYGTKSMLEWMSGDGHIIDFAIIGEPTCEKVIGDVIKIGRRGSINFTLKVIGHQGHVAYPDLANNPCPLMIKILNDLDLIIFDDESNLEITSIDTGNMVTNVIPAEIFAKFNIRFTNKHTADSLILMLNEVIGRHTHDYTLDTSCNALPFVSKQSNLTDIFAEAALEQTKTRPSFSMSGGTSDARFIQAYCPILEFGLRSELAHKINESVEIGDLQSLYNVYYEALNKIFSLEG
jgi:succinyl-diaminopimelate desuccinylase